MQRSFDPGIPFGHWRVVAKLCIFVGTILGGLAFGWAAGALGCELMASFLWSGLGSLVGCWAGWKVHQRYFR